MAMAMATATAMAMAYNYFRLLMLAPVMYNYFFVQGVSYGEINIIKLQWQMVMENGHGKLSW